MTEGDRLGASLPSRTPSASWKSPAETPRRYRIGSRASRLVVRRAQRGSSAELNRIRSACRAGSPVADLDPLDLDRPDPGLDHAFRPMAMPDQAVPAIGQLQVLPGRPGRLPPRPRWPVRATGALPTAKARSADRRSRRAGETGQCCYPRSWRIAPSWRFWQASSTYLDTPPSSPRHHPVSAIARPLIGCAVGDVGFDRDRVKHFRQLPCLSTSRGAGFCPVSKSCVLINVGQAEGNTDAGQFSVALLSVMSSC